MIRPRRKNGVPPQSRKISEIAVTNPDGLGGVTGLMVSLHEQTEQGGEEKEAED